MLCQKLGQDPGSPPSSLGLGWIDDLFHFHQEVKPDDDDDELCDIGNVPFDLEVIHAL